MVKKFGKKWVESIIPASFVIIGGMLVQTILKTIGVSGYLGFLNTTVFGVNLLGLAAGITALALYGRFKK